MSSQRFNAPKIAYYATLYHHLAAFDLPFMKILQAQGYEIHAYGKADRGKEILIQNNVICHDINTSRSPVAFWSNISALLKLIKALRAEAYAMVHVDTPVASIIGRIAAKIARVPVVIYTAHGFHFYKGAPIGRWLFYYTAEWLMSFWTDYLITINKEDYELALRKFHVRKEILFIDGVGVDLTPFAETENNLQTRADFREKLGLQDNDFVVICIAEMIQRKNQLQLIEAASILKNQNLNIKFLMVGEGVEAVKYQLKSEELGLGDVMFFLGYRRDIPQLLSISDLSVLLSMHEGLPKGLMESMAAGKPIVATNVRGNRDIVQNGVNGYIVPYNNVEETAKAIRQIYESKSTQISMQNTALEQANNYDLNKIVNQVTRIYEKALAKHSKKYLLVEHTFDNFFNSRIGLAQKLIRQGHQVTALFPKTSQKIPDIAGLQVLNYTLKRNSVNPIWAIQHLLEFHNICRKVQPDVIHSFKFEPNFFIVLSNLFSNKKIVLHITGLGSAFTNDSFKLILIKTISKIIFLVNFLRADRIIFQNPDDSKALWGYSLWQHKSRIIKGSGVNLTIFDKRNYNLETLRRERNVTKDSIVVTIVSRLVWEKGFEELLESFVPLIKNNPDKNLILNIVGDSDLDNPSSLTAYDVKKYSNYRGVRFLGKRSDIAQLLAISDFYVYPSYYREGIPRCVLEALATGIPVITTNMPGCRLTVEEGKNGFLVPPQDKDALYNALITMLKQRHNWTRMGEHSRRMAEEIYSEEKIYDQITEVYQELL